MTDAVSLTSLWLPIVLSAVLVFIASSIVHMVLPYHRTDYGQVPKEDEVMNALRPFNIPPGDYMMPKPGSPADMRSPAFTEKWKRGPVGIITIMPGGTMSMTNQLVGWFIYCLVVSVFAAYLTSRAVPAGAEYLRVSQIASTAAFIAYALGQWPMTIWYRRSVAASLKGTFDGLIYGFLTGGALGWLWPR